MTKGSLDISVYHAPSVPTGRGGCASTDRVSEAPRASGRVSVSVAAAVLSLLLHLAVATSVMWGFGGPKSQPRRQSQLGSAAQASSDADPAMQWIRLDATDSSEADLEDGSTSIRPLSIAMLPVSADTTVADAVLDFDATTIDEPSLQTAAPGDAAMRAALYGRYLGQINARIDRAWSRPRNDTGAASFSCLVRIDQDGAGNVREVTLERCNGDERWQLSLVQAIETASPLPAPPDRAVFTSVVHMLFKDDSIASRAPAGLPRPAAQLQ